MKKIIALILMQLMISGTCVSASDIDTGTWAYLSATKSINKQWSLSATSSFRTSNDNRFMYFWFAGGTIHCNIRPWLAADANFTYFGIHSHSTSKRGDVWRPGILPMLSLTPKWNMGAYQALFSETWGYKWMPEVWKDGVCIHGKANHELRHKLTLRRPIPQSRFTPYARAELRHNSKLERVRFTLGSLIKLTAHTTLDTGLVYQDMHNSTKTLAISIGYRFRL